MCMNAINGGENAIDTKCIRYGHLKTPEAKPYFFSEIVMQ